MKHPRLLLLLFITLLIPHLSGGVGQGVQVDADLPGVAIFLNNTYIGDTPLVIPDLKAGEYQITGTISGHTPQVKNVSVPSEGSGQVSFSFGAGSSDLDPGAIKISDCSETPEQSGLQGTSMTVVTLPDGDMMAYYSGFSDGVQCAGSADGSRWHEYPDGCLEIPGSGDALLPLSSPWVYNAKDGGYWMIYRSGDENGHSLSRAFSGDGIRFTPDGGVTIHHLSETGADFSEQYSIPTGIRLANGSIRMYYSLQGGGIKSAISVDDGQTWTDEEGSRLNSATDPSIILLPDGRFGLFYVDFSEGSKGQKIKVATSSDGITFNSSDTGTIVESDHKGVWILDPEIHVSKDGRWTLFFSVMGSPGEAGITVPTVMQTTLDPACLVTRLAGSEKGE